MHRYRELRVWHRSVQLARDVYDLTESFPKRELFSSADQMRRAALSIPSNIAEGSSRPTAAGFRHFLDVAMGSAYELDTQLEILMDRAWFDRPAAVAIRVDLVDVRSMLYGLRRTVTSQPDQ